jgi:parvulin-like peptidyl-prolyl isomerase
MVLAGIPLSLFLEFHMSSHRRFVFSCLLQCCLCAPLLAAPATPPAAKLPADTVVARQGTAVVTLADIDAFAQRMDEKQRPGFFDSPKRLESLITNLLTQRQLAAEAEKAGLDKGASVQAQIRLASEDILGKARMDAMRGELKLPDFTKLAREEYLGHKEKYVKPGQLDVKHILIATDKHSDEEAKALAEQVRAEAVAHPDQFDALIEKYSEDPSKAQNHGLMTEANGKHYVAAFSSAASALKVPGEISPVVKTKFGYHVIELVKRTSDEPLKFEAVRDQITEQLRSTYVDKAVKQHVDELRNQHMDANADAVASLRDRYGSVPTPSEAEASAQDAPKPQP